MNGMISICFVRVALFLHEPREIPFFSAELIACCLAIHSSDRLQPGADGVGDSGRFLNRR